MSGVKEYKLKKDIITPVEAIPAGTVFNFYNGTGDAEGYEYLVVEEIVEDFDEWFEKIEESPERWRAEKYGEYFIATNYRKVVSVTELNTNDDDDYCWEIGNYFKTGTEAANYRSYLLAKQRLKDSAGGFVPRQGEWVYYVFCDGEGALKTLAERRFIPGAIHFRTFEDANKSSKRYADDWHFVINYETGNL